VIVALGEIGPEAREAIPALMAILESPETRRERTAVLAAAALRRIDPESELSLKALLDILHHGSDDSEVMAAGALADFGPSAAPAVPHLKGMLVNDDPLRTAAAARTLAAIGPAAKSAVPDLVALLASKNLLVRVPVAEAAWKLGHIPEAIPVLASAVSKGWYRAIEPLGHVGPEAAAAVPALKNAQHHRDWRVRLAATDALRQIER
jgi:HEAT repeat protein